jgi:hypothetical protein
MKKLSNTSRAKPLLVSTEKVRELVDDQLEHVVGGKMHSQPCSKSYGTTGF